MAERRISVMRRSFSLIELLVALAVLGTIAAIIIPKFQNVQHQAVQATLAAEVNQIQSSVEQWFALGGTAKTGDLYTSGDNFFPGDPDYTPQNIAAANLAGRILTVLSGNNIEQSFGDMSHGSTSYPYARVPGGSYLSGDVSDSSGPMNSTSVSLIANPTSIYNGAPNGLYVPGATNGYVATYIDDENNWWAVMMDPNTHQVWFRQIVTGCNPVCEYMDATIPSPPPAGY